MSPPLSSILPEKLKESSHLLYKIQQKHEQWGVPKCALLIGAGCSFPTLPLGSGLIQYCKQLCYIRDIFPKEAVAIESTFLKKPFGSLLDDFIKEKENSAKLSYIHFVKSKEASLLKKIQENKLEILKKVPIALRESNWVDFELHFLNDAKYGFWMDAYSSSPRERQRFIESLIENCNPSGAYIILALLIEKKFISNILTTNFDDFINDTLLYYTSCRPRFYADDEISQYISIHSDKPNIIKLHGDYRYANIKNTDDETVELTKKMEDKLRELLQNLDLIVIGYNGADYSIMNVLEEVKTPNCELLWCDLDDQKVHWRVANLINNSSNSWFIKIKGFDDIIKDFYLEFVQSPPNLISKATLRQEELSMYIKEYSTDLKRKAVNVAEVKSLEKIEKSWELVSKALKEASKEKKVEILSDALKLNPKNEAVLIHRGLAYKELNNIEAAIDDLNEAIKLNPDHADAFFNRGYLLEVAGDYKNAIADFDMALKLGFKNHAMLNNNYAVAYRKLKNYDLAIQYVTIGLTQNPGLYHLYGTLALIYSDKGDDENFYKYLEISLKKGCEIYRFLDEDPGFERFKNVQRFKELLSKYNQEKK